MEHRDTAADREDLSGDGSSPSFGQKLKMERESRGLTLDYVSQTTRVPVHHLTALEQDDLEALPDDVFVKGYLRAYAECLNVDADLVLEAYACERASRQTASTGNGKDPVVEEMARVLEVPEKERRSRSPLMPAAVALILVLVVFGAWWVYTRSTPETPAPRSAADAAVPAAETGVLRPADSRPGLETPSLRTTPAKPESGPSEQPVERTASEPEPITPEPAVEPEPITPELAVESEPSTPERTVERAAVEPESVRDVESPVTTPASPLPSVSEYGVGTGVENRQLVGEGNRFAEGTKVWFWNRIRGGASGQRIHHVWLHEGVEKTRVPLRLGGPHWRTQSNKTLWPGSAGDWVVEARDESGHVLARREFVCVP
jgi:cytoskeletal protein RodZ